jgi:regulator of RNase E activity RraB
MQGQWEFYECTVDDRHRALISVDVSLFDAAPDPARPFVLRVAATDDRDANDRIEQELETLVAAFGGTYVGRAGFDGARRYYFYLADQAAADKAREAIGGRALEVGGFHDPQWSEYFGVLYPNDLAWQFIQDRHTIAALREQGDDLETPRRIEHAAVFPNAAARDGFAAKLGELGFEIDDTSDDLAGPMSHEVEFSATRKPLEVLRLNEKLVILATEAGGEYDGWGCEVVANKSA